MIKILLVGSDKELTAMTEKMLIRKQFEIHSVIGLEEAICEANAVRYDIVISDCDMQVDDMKRFCGSIKRKDGIPKLLIVSSSPDEEERTLRAGADDWMKKPYKINVLAARIEALFRK